MKIWLLTVILAMVTLVVGCGSETAAAGIGLASGFAASNTIKGIEVDLAAHEAALIEQYNTEVEGQARSEVLDRLRDQINNTVYLRQAAQTTDNVIESLGESPGKAEQYGALAAVILSLGLNLFQKRKGDIMKKTTRAIVKGIEAAEAETKPNPTNPVKAAVKMNLQAAGIYNQGDDLIRSLKVSR